MKNIPNKIYLQVDPEKENPEFFEELETTWCSDRINDNDIPYYRKRIKVEPEVSDDFGGNEQLRDTLTIIYQLAQKGKTLSWEFDRKTKGAYNFNIKLDVSEYDS